MRLRCDLRTLRVLFDLRDLRTDLRALRLVLRRRRLPPPTKLSIKAPPVEHPQSPIFFYDIRREKKFNVQIKNKRLITPTLIPPNLLILLLRQTIRHQQELQLLLFLRSKHYLLK